MRFFLFYGVWCVFLGGLEAGYIYMCVCVCGCGESWLKERRTSAFGKVFLASGERVYIYIYMCMHVHMVVGS